MSSILCEVDPFRLKTLRSEQEKHRKCSFRINKNLIRCHRNCSSDVAPIYGTMDVSQALRREHPRADALEQPRVRSQLNPTKDNHAPKSKGKRNEANHAVHELKDRDTDKSKIFVNNLRQSNELTRGNDDSWKQTIHVHNRKLNEVALHNHVTAKGIPSVCQNLVINNRRSAFSCAFNCNG